ncbi:putative beta-D-xylosidase 7 [Dorcoceras hygrometricum]|uniref:Putative beta-D-xylosidase 7 n=1 Tax=Dorcoceras hygrometricum TaxID=472368 RepID=A0A2Z7CFM9_9LAMI|nr:putative beta-D-xylosidase 7 [Dorcoceras hygrometricum]
MTNWFLQALSVIPRGSWGDVSRRFTMIRWVEDRAHRPPTGVPTFYINQVDMGLSFPIPKFILGERKNEGSTYRGGGISKAQGESTACEIPTVEMEAHAVEPNTSTKAPPKERSATTLLEALNFPEVSFVVAPSANGIDRGVAQTKEQGEVAAATVAQGNPSSAGLNPRPAVKPGFPENNTDNKTTKPQRDMGSNPSTESNYKTAVNSKNKMQMLCMRPGTTAEGYNQGREPKNSMHSSTESAIDMCGHGANKSQKGDESAESPLALASCDHTAEVNNFVILLPANNSLREWYQSKEKLSRRAAPPVLLKAKARNDGNCRRNATVNSVLGFEAKNNNREKISLTGYNNATDPGNWYQKRYPKLCVSTKCKRLRITQQLIATRGNTPTAEFPKRRSFTQRLVATKKRANKTNSCVATASCHISIAAVSQHNATPKLPTADRLHQTLNDGVLISCDN